MKPTLLQRLDSSVRHMLPFASVLLLVMLTVVPTRIPDFAGVAPALALIGVFYWSVYRPDLFPALAGFLAGLFQDIVLGSPLGVHAMVFLLVQGGVATQRRFLLGAPFAVVWFAFLLTAVAAGLLSWVLVAMAKTQMVPFQSLLLSYVITLALYPVLAWVLARGHALVLGRV